MALLSLVVALPSLAAWAADRSPAWRDSAILYAPIRTLVSGALRGGRLPLWNPHEALGKPLFAEGLHGVLHPLSLFAALVDPGGIDLLIALYLVAAALGAFLLARELGLDDSQAFLAGGAFGLSGFVLSMTGNLVFLAGAASLPWQVAALAAAGRGARLAVPLGALATAVTLLSGDAQMAIVAFALGAALAAERGGRRGLLRAAGATLLGGAVAAVQVVPTLAALEASARSAGLQEIERAQFAFAPARLVELLIPGLFVRLDAPPSPAVFSWLGGPYVAGNDFPFSPSVYLGIPLVALAACAPLRDRRVRVLALAAAFLLWLALGHFAGARPALDWVPVWGKFRYTEKLVAPLSLVAALLAAFGARGADGAGPPRRHALIAAAALAAVPLLALAVASGLADGPPRAAEALAANLRAGLPHALLGAAGFALAVLLPLRSAWRGASFCALTAASLLAAVPHARVLLPREDCRAWPGALPLVPPGPRLYFPNRTVAFPTPWLAGRRPTLAEELSRTACGLGKLGATSQNVRDRIDNFWSYGGLGSRRFATLLAAMPGRWGQGSRHFSVTHASLIRLASADEQRLNALATSGGTLVASDPAFGIELHAVPHLPWARLATRVEPAASMEEAAQRFASIALEGRDAVAVESERPVPNGGGVVRAVAREPEGASIEVEAFSEGLLVVNDAWWPGWVARIDGREAPILPVNVVARGVVVPAGRHVVTMAYDPPEVRVGLAVSSAGLLAAVGLVLRDLRRRRPTAEAA
jgi:hypothetical protein